MRWGLIIDRGDGAWNMAVDEAMFELKDSGRVGNVLRLYVFDPSAVTIGYFQRISETVDLDLTSRMEIPVIRRITGGGAVYHDSRGEITYSVVASSELFPKDVKKSYELICNGVVKAIGRFGLEARFVPVNDVVVGDKKVSGSAQIRRGRALLQHGTLMYDTDIALLGRVLRVPKEKLSSKKVLRIEDRVTTLSRELGRRVKYEEVLEALIEGFSEALRVELDREGYGEEVLELAGRLKGKYLSREWNFKR